MRAMLHIDRSHNYEAVCCIFVTSSLHRVYECKCVGDGDRGEHRIDKILCEFKFDSPEYECEWTAARVCVCVFPCLVSQSLQYMRSWLIQFHLIDLFCTCVYINRWMNATAHRRYVRVTGIVASGNNNDTTVLYSRSNV